MNALNPSHAALIAEVTALRAQVQELELNNRNARADTAKALSHARLESELGLAEDTNNEPAAEALRAELRKLESRDAWELLEAEVTALRASLNDAVELVESLRADRDKFRAACSLLLNCADLPGGSNMSDILRAVHAARAALGRSAP